MALWRVEEAADFLGIRPKTLYEWVRTDRVPYRKLGFNVRFDPEELEDWVRQQPAGGSRRSAGRQKKKSRQARTAARAEAASPRVEALAQIGVEAADRLKRVESELGAQLSFPQRQELRDLAKRLQDAVDAVHPESESRSGSRP